MRKQRLVVAVSIATFFLPFAGVHSQAQSVDRNAAATTDIGTDAKFSQTLNQQVGSMRFVGKVVAESGKLLWDSVPIEVNCNGTIRFNTLADSKGRFSIDASPRASEVGETKRDPKHVSPAEFVGCKVSAKLEGFKSTEVTIANGSIMDSPDLGTITLRRDEEARGFAVSLTTAATPGDARKEFDKAHTDAIDKRFDSARRHLQKAVTIDPLFAEAWYHLGALEETDKPLDASEAYLRAVKADPAYIQPYERIAALSALEKRWQEVVDASNHALELNPAGTPQIWYFNSVGNYNLGHAAIAEKSAETSLRMDPSHVAPNTEQLLAVILAGRGDYEDARNHLVHCLSYTAPGPNSDVMKQQISQLDTLLARKTK